MFAAAITFLYFVTFCLLTNKVQSANPKIESLSQPNAAIAFSFFSVFTWVSFVKLCAHDNTLLAFFLISFSQHLISAQEFSAAFDGGALVN